MCSSSVSSGSFQAVRKQLDDLGFYQVLVPECLPLVQALIHKLQSTQHDLHLCKKRLKSAERPESSDIESCKRHVDKAKRRSKRDSEENGISSVRIEQERRKIEKLEKKVFDLELLNSQASAIVKRLQEESMEKSKKILKMESGLNRAKVVTKSSDLLKPKIEMSSLVKPLAKKLSGRQMNQDSTLDLVKMYQKRNDLLERELSQMREKLNEAQKMLRKMDGQLKFDEALQKEGASSSSPEDMSSYERSAYMFKLIRENERLKEELCLLDPSRESGETYRERIVMRSRNRSGGPSVGLTRSCEDIRSQVERSHMMMHNMCLKNQVGHLQQNSTENLDLHRKGKQLRAQQEQIREISEKIQSVTDENKELKRRIQELNELRSSQRSKIDELIRQQNILLQSGTSDHAKIEELIRYIEQQRDVYRSGVEKLLGKLDVPSNVQNPKKSDEPDLGSRKSTKPKLELEEDHDELEDILKEIQNNSRRVIDNYEKRQQRNHKNISDVSEERSYHASPYRYNSDTSGFVTDDHWTRMSELRSELAETQGSKSRIERSMREEILSLKRENEKLYDDIKILREKNQKLEVDLTNWESKYYEAEQKLKRRQPTEDRDVVDSSSSVLNQLKLRLQTQQKTITELESQVSLKQKHLQTLSDDKDRAQDLLDNKTREYYELKKKYDELTMEVSKYKSDNAVGDQRLSLTLNELENTKRELADARVEIDRLQDKASAEKSVLTQHRIENNKLKEQLREKENQKVKLESEISELKAHVQKYVNEVKRVEELFAAREKERLELLSQYKQLSIEIETSESFGRKMEAQVESLKIQLATKESELAVSQQRLADLERDLVEMSLNNENYRAKVANLTAQIDRAALELRETQNQTTWANTDLSNIHDLAVQLNKQKNELQTQIAEQNDEIEHLNSEIRTLRDEVTHLSDQVQKEREKSRNVQDSFRTTRHSEEGQDDYGSRR